MRIAKLSVAALAAAGLLAGAGTERASAEILALVNYESKPAEALKAFKNPVPGATRQEGIAVVDVDPASANFGKVMRKIELPPDLVAHHIFYNKDSSKAYVTALGKPELRVIDLEDEALPMKVVDVPDCMVGEDVVFSQEHGTWYITCMGSDAVIVGDAGSDKPLQTIKTSKPYPHGIAVHDGIDRLLITSTVRPTDLGDPGETITVIEASSGKVLNDIKVSNKESPSGEAPVEILFVPKSDPPVAYITNMFGGSLWTATWNAEKKDFDVAQAVDFTPMEAGVPLEMYFDDDATRLYVTTAKPGHVHVFDISADVAKPTLVKSIATGEGAHHVAFTKDFRLGFVQNSLLNLPGMSDGSITVVDFEKGEAVASIDTLKNDGFNPNSIVLLPEWNHPAGH